MLLAAGRGSEDRWEFLQQPAHPSEVEPQFRALLAALDMGWRIEQPVYLRPRFSDSGPRVYHFILRRVPLAAPRMLSVPQGAEVDRFVRAEGVQVIVAR